MWEALQCFCEMLSLHMHMAFGLGLTQVLLQRNVFSRKEYL